MIQNSKVFLLICSKRFIFLFFTIISDSFKLPLKLLDPYPECSERVRELTCNLAEKFQSEKPDRFSNKDNCGSKKSHLISKICYIIENLNSNRKV